MRYLLLSLGTLLIATLATAQTAISSHLEDNLRKSLEKKAVLVRNFYQGSLLRYDDALHAVGAQEGGWTVSGFVEVMKVRVEDGALTIEGQRLAVVYDAKQRNMRLARYDEPVVIKIPISSDDDAQHKLAQVFVRAGEDETALVPSYWRHYARTHEIADLSKPLKEQGTFLGDFPGGVLRVGQGVLPPRPTYRPEPSYTLLARKFRMQGQVGVLLVLNENGEPQDLSIVKPLGAGLDEAAVKALEQWRFDPARKDGKPVKVRIQIDVDFHLY